MKTALSALCILLLATAVAAYDSEWPPQTDPDATNPQPGPGLQMDLTSIPIPAAFSAWFSHQHSNGSWSEFPMGVAYGDLAGADDQQDLHAVMYMRDELVVAARLNVVAGTMTPLWAWRVPNNPGGAPGSSHEGRFATNPLIWDFDGDGANEVALVAPKLYDLWGTPTWGRAIYVLRTDPNPTYVDIEFNVPPPLVVASSPANDYHQTADVGDRLSVCDVSGTGRDLASHSHDGVSLTLWSLDDDGAGGFDLVKNYGVNWAPPPTHEFNAVDVDRDGYDEFIWDGILDFVDDVGGVPTPTNGTTGVWHWRTGSDNTNGRHVDQMFAIDVDPAHPGLEIVGTPQVPWTDHQGNPRLGVDTIWDLSGNILRENADCPYTHPQTVYAGNWSAARSGFEMIFVPKSFGNPTVGGGEHWLAGSYAVDVGQNELAVDGAFWKVVDICGTGDTPTRATGPCHDMTQIDWDGVRTSDEILNPIWHYFVIWRMGEKGDWGAVPPAGMATQAEIQNPWHEAGCDVWWEFYQGSWGQKVATNGWNHGGPGLYDHYYKKLGEAYPGSGLYVLDGYDAAWDYREEAIALTPYAVNVYANPDPLDIGHSHSSPRFDPEYRKWRMEMTNEPYVYQGADVTAVDDVVVPDPSRGSLEAAPNPFNPRTRLSFVLDEDAEIELDIVDVLGRRVATIAMGSLPAGEHAYDWRGTTDDARALPSGTYFARLVADGVVKRTKILLLR